MKWVTKDIGICLNERDYIDTAIIPLIPITFIENVKSTVSQGEFIAIIASEVERQFKGRVILFPGFTYLNSEGEEKANRLEDWINHILESGTKHVALLTSDSSWKTYEDKFAGKLIWLPSIPLEHLDSQQEILIIRDQINQIIPSITELWSGSTFHNSDT